MIFTRRAEFADAAHRQRVFADRDSLARFHPRPSSVPESSL